MNPYTKGHDFEAEVADWMKKNLRHHRIVRRNEWVVVSNVVAPFECDIHARTTDRIYWYRVHLAGCLMMMAAIVFAVPIPLLRTPDAIAVFVFGMALAIGSIIRERQLNSHVWIECKNLRGNVKRDHVNKLWVTISMVQDHRRARWQPRYVYFFSATDFDRDAIHFASRYDIHCYRRRGDGFEKVN